MSKLAYDDITYKIIGAAFEVHNALGPGFLESIYEEAMVHELELRGLQVQQQVSVPITYKNKLIGTHILDLVVEDKVIVELKTVKEFADIHSSILVSYLTATKLPVGLLLNFAKPSLEHKRIIR